MGKALELTGQRFGKLTVQHRLNEKKNGLYLWECKCDCGNTCKVIGSSLKSGNTKSCGCGRYDGFKKYNEKQSQQAEIPIGTKFGKLTVIKKIGYKKQIEGHNRLWYLCQCDCGNFKEAMGNSLKNGHNISCGKCLTSKGEFLIQQVLDENNILYNYDTVFQQLYEESGRKLRFDFIIYNPDMSVNRFVEYDGRQHQFGPDTSYWGHSTDTLETIKEKDNIKNKFCLQHNYTLIRIPHSKTSITLEDIFGDKYAIKGDDLQ